MLLNASTSNVTIAGTARTPGTLWEINTLPASGNITVTDRGSIRGAAGTNGTNGTNGASVANLSGQASAYGQTAANGSAETAARSDHYHALPAAPTSVTGSAGTATGAAWTTSLVISRGTTLIEPATGNTTSKTGINHLIDLFQQINWLNANKPTVWIGTQEAYDALTTKPANGTVIMIRDP
jgi:hypothetical protein